MTLGRQLALLRDPPSFGLPALATSIGLVGLGRSKYAVLHKPVLQAL
jgi:hypothetical protein